MLCGLPMCSCNLSTQHVDICPTNKQVACVSLATCSVFARAELASARAQGAWVCCPWRCWPGTLAWRCPSWGTPSELQAAGAGPGERSWSRASRQVHQRHPWRSSLTQQAKRSALAQRMERANQLPSRFKFPSRFSSADRQELLAELERWARAGNVSLSRHRATFPCKSPAGIGKHFIRDCAFLASSRAHMFGFGCHHACIDRQPCIHVTLAAAVLFTKASFS